MRTLFFALLFTGLSAQGFSQIANDFMVGGGFDLIKTDNSGVFEKFQTGVEFNYFLHRRFTGTAGFELWTDQDLSFVLGGRWYPIDNLFVRLRALIGENDLSTGAGWSQPISESWRVEAMGDFYFEGTFGMRVGIAYLIRRKE